MVRQLALDEKIAGSTPASPAPPSGGPPAYSELLVSSDAGAEASWAGAALGFGSGAEGDAGAAAPLPEGAAAPAGAVGVPPAAAAAASAAFLAWATFKASALARSWATNSMYPE